MTTSTFAGKLIFVNRRIAASALAAPMFLAMTYLFGGFPAPILRSAYTTQMLATDLLNSICKPSKIWDASASANRPAPIVEPVSSDHISQGKKVTVVRLTFPPGGFSPKHHHGGWVNVYVVSGAIRSQLAGLPAATYKAGETFFEPIGTVHMFAENISTTEPAVVLAMFIHDEGTALTTYH